jgi:tagatose 1,6-diphosphate aldolase
MNTQQFSKNNKYLMLAIDHQDGFKKMLNPQDPAMVKTEEIIALKTQILQALKNEFTGVLLDIEYGLPAYQGIEKPFLLRIEKSGHVEKDGIKVMELEHTASELKEKGASGVKLLLHCNPFKSATLSEVEKAKKVLEDAHNNDLPLFLEILTYVDSNQEIAKGDLILKSIKLFLDNGVTPDIWKLEYPGNDRFCYQITELVKLTPWIVLSGGVNFDHFQAQQKTATVNGASGFLAGRAIWQDVANYQGVEREKFLQTEIKKRFKILNKITLGF